jgi:hypothetical protein
MIVKPLKNKSGAEGVLVGISQMDLFRLRQEGMCQIDIRSLLTGLCSIVLVYGETEAQIMAIVEPNSTPVIVRGN